MRKAFSTEYLIIGFPPNGCSTLVNLERMRVPCPAAKMMAINFIGYALLKNSSITPKNYRCKARPRSYQVIYPRNNFLDLC